MTPRAAAEIGRPSPQAKYLITDFTVLSTLKPSNEEKREESTLIYNAVSAVSTDYSKRLKCRTSMINFKI